jgi:hypothetical protein
LPDIATINGIDITTLASFGGVAFADGQTLDGQNVALVSDAHTFISSQTASASSSLSFTSGIDSTYDVYEFHFVNMHPQTDNVDFMFQVNASGQTGFNEVITSTFFRAYHNETDTATAFGYDTRWDQAQGTAYQPLTYETGFDSDQSCSGVLTLYDPSSTTFVKHYIARTNNAYAGNFTIDNFISGYINTTAAIDEISFKFDSGNIDAGEVRMYGVATS